MKRMVRSVCLVVILTVGILGNNAAKADSPHSQEIWWQTFINYRINSKFGLAYDMGHRRNEHFVNSYFQGFVRLGGVYFFDKHSITLGMAIFETNGLYELRPYQRLSLVQTIGRLQIMHRYRFEQRFRSTNAGKTQFNFRVGYQLNLQYPLFKNQIEPKTAFLWFQDEIFANFGGNIAINYFDQNRILFGMGYQFSKMIVVQVGYQYSFAQLPTPYQYRNSHAIRLNLVLNLANANKE